MIVLLSKIRRWKYSVWVYSILFSFLVFFQCVSFNYLAYNELPIECFSKAPLVFWGFFLPKICISLLFAAIIPITKHKWWTIGVSLLVSVWCFAEIIYYRINSTLIDEYSLSMIHNMNGFWDSFLAFIQPLDIVLIFPVLFSVILFILFNNSQQSKEFTFFLISIAFLCHIGGTLSIDVERKRSGWWDVKGNAELSFNPFCDFYLGFEPITYSKFTSVIHCFVLDVIRLVEIPFKSEQQINFDENDIISINSITNVSSDELVPQPQRNLIIILIESFESWALSDIATPNIYHFINENQNICICNHITSQIRGGVSGDGQMIINTGVLPVLQGATSFRYPTNTFPSLSSLYDCSAMIQPGDMTIWNQAMMSKAYCINENIVVDSGDDNDTFNILTQSYHNFSYVLALSTASHTPFKLYSSENPIVSPENTPSVLRDYLSCLHYTDQCLKDFLLKIETDESLNKSVIVITGDHTIFDDKLRGEFQEFCDSCEEDSFANMRIEKYCPLIIYSPDISHRIVLDDIYYQMDIFPTILNLVGCSSTYYWTGFGINLLESEPERVLSPDEASILSDKMIHSNYWQTITEKHGLSN